MFWNLFKKKKGIINLNVADWLYLLGGLSIYIALTIATITKFSIWFDEAFGAYLIKFNFIDIARYTATDVHPPVYYWILKLWSLIFGTGELALRSLSVLFGVTTIFLGYLLVNQLFNKKAARIGLLFMAISPMLIRYGQEARMYTLVATIALAATYVLTLAMGSKRKLPWVIYGILISLGMWTHYFSAIIWISHWIWRADIVRHSTNNFKQFIKSFFTKEWILAHIVAVTLFLPWLPFMIAQFTTVQKGFWIPPVDAGTFTNFITNVIYYRDINETTSWLAAALFITAVFMLWLSRRVYIHLNADDKKYFKLILSIAFWPMVVLFILSLPPLKSAFVERYLIVSSVGVALFMGTVIALGSKYIKKWTQFWAVSLVVLMMIIGVMSVYILGNYNKNINMTNNPRGIIEAVKQKSAKGEPIIAAAEGSTHPGFFYEAIYYSSKDHPIYFIDMVNYRYGALDMLKYNDDHKIKDVQAFTRRHPLVWYVEISNQDETKAPYTNWTKVRDIKINDPVSGRLEYKATEYQIGD